MTRKLLSGVLAFAMVFGCTAPVAMAEETVVEEVEQYAYYNPNFVKPEYELTVTAGSTVTLELNQAPAKKPTLTIGGTAEAELKYIEVSYSSDYSKITLKAKAGLTEKDVREVKVTYTPVEGDTYTTTTAKTNLKVVAAENTAITPSKEELATTFTAVVGEKKEVATFKVAGTKAPYSVDVKTTTNASSYVTFATEDVKDTTTGKVIATKLVATGVKATNYPAGTLDTDKVKAIVSVKATAGTDAVVYKEIVLTVNDPAVDPEVTGLKLTADKTTITVTSGESILIAQATKSNEYGDNVDYDNAKLVWSVNGTTMKFEGRTAELKNALDETYATLVKTTDNDGMVKFSATKPGDYAITVSDKDGNMIVRKVITVMSVTANIKDNAVHIGTDTNLNTNDYKGGIKVTTPGTTVDLSGIKFAVRDTNLGGDDVNALPIADVGITVAGYKVLGAYVGTTQIASESVAKKAVSVDEKGLVTVADETNAVMKELLTKADGKDITFNIKVTFKDAAGKTDTLSLWADTPVQVVVTKPSEKAKSIELYLGGKKVTTESVVMTVGETYDFDVMVKDGHGYTDAVDQRAVWQISGNTDKNVYATVDQSGVVTPLLASIKEATLKVASIANPDLSATVKLVIVGETTKPTEKPTEAPTQAPETKTGTVNTSSSALNIRAAASTGATVVAKAAKGSSVTILGEENGFYKVQLADGTVGYASKAYIKVTTDTPVVTITATTTANLKLRTSAPSGSVITVMPKGATVKVIEGGQSWAKVEYNGKVGYASNNYLTFNTVG